MVAVRTRGLKLVVNPARGTEELYDLAADPGETRNVAGERPADLAAMRSRLAAWQQGLRASGAQPVQAIDKETVEGLKALGYVD